MFSKDNFIYHNNADGFIVILDSEGKPKYNIRVDNLTKSERINNLLKLHIKKGDNITYTTLQFKDAEEAIDALELLNDKINQRENINYDNEYKGSSTGIKWNIENEEELWIKNNFQYRTENKLKIDGKVKVDGDLIIAPFGNYETENKSSNVYYYHELYDMMISNKLISGERYKLIDYQTYCMRYVKTPAKCIEEYNCEINNMMFDSSLKLNFCFSGEKHIDYLWSNSIYDLTYDLKTNPNLNKIYLSKHLKMEHGDLIVSLNFEGALNGYITMIVNNCKFDKPITFKVFTYDEVYLEFDFVFIPKYERIQFPIYNCAILDSSICPNMLEIIEQYHEVVSQKETLEVSRKIGRWKLSPATYPDCLYEGLILTAISPSAFSTTAISNIFPSDIIHYDINPDYMNPKGKILFRKDFNLNVEAYYDYRFACQQRWDDENGYPYHLTPLYFVCISDLDFTYGVELTYIKAVNKVYHYDIMTYSLEDMISFLSDELEEIYMVGDKICMGDGLQIFEYISFDEYSENGDILEKNYELTMSSYNLYKTFNDRYLNVSLSKEANSVVFLHDVDSVYIKNEANNIIFNEEVSKFESKAKIENLIFNNINDLVIEREVLGKHIFDDIENSIIEKPRTNIDI